MELFSCQEPKLYNCFAYGRLSKRDAEKALRENTVDFLIDQNGYVQGYRPLNILADMILKGKLPEEEYLYTDIKIMTKYTLASQN